MIGASSAAALRHGAALLERAINYTLGPLQAVTPAALNRPTPCAEWDLGALLTHMSDSMAAMHEAVALNNVGLDPEALVADPGDSAAAGDPPARQITVLRGQARQLLAVLAGQHGQLVRVGGYPLPVCIVASAGAVDIAVHGWDVAQACGSRYPIPVELAGRLLAVSRLLVTEADRPTRFGSPVPVSPQASTSDQLIAYLGRTPADPRPATDALAG